VGCNLHDHPAVALRYAGSPELRRASRDFAAARFHPEEQLVAKVASGLGDAAFDLHLYTQGGERRGDPGQWIWEYMVGVLPTRARGRVTIRSTNPSAAPLIDHAFLSDPGGEDLERLVRGFRLLREVTRQSATAALLGAEILPGAEYGTADEIRSVIRRLVGTAFHPVGT